MTQYENPLDRMARFKQEEEDRVAGLIKRDKKERVRERDRQAAELEVAEGKFVNLGDAVVEPTPEWMEKGDTRTFIPKQPKDTTKIAKSVRRVLTPTIVKLYQDGKLNEDHYHACMVYRRVYEQAGLRGRYKSSYISLTGNVGGGGGMAQHPMAQHHNEAEARELYRQARMVINPKFVQVFEFVAIYDLSLRLAATKAKKDNSRIFHNFRYTCERLVDFWRSRGIDIVASMREIDGD